MPIATQNTSKSTTNAARATVDVSGATNDAQQQLARMLLEKKEKRRAANARYRANVAARKDAGAFQVGRTGIYDDPQYPSFRPAYSRVTIPRAQPGYGPSPQTRHQQQMPLQPIGASQINGMQGPMTGLNLTVATSGMNPGMRQQFMSEYIKQALAGGARW